MEILEKFPIGRDVAPPSLRIALLLEKSLEKAAVHRTFEFLSYFRELLIDFSQTHAARAVPIVDRKGEIGDEGIGRLGIGDVEDGRRRQSKGYSCDGR